MNVTIEQLLAALPGAITIISAFAVCSWRITDLNRRVIMLEDIVRANSSRVVIVETKLISIESLLVRIAEKLRVL